MRVVRIQFYLLLLTILILRGSKGITKEYISSWDLSNEENWQGGVFPCPGRRITFEQEQSFPVFLNKRMSLESIDFPFNTELIFGNESSLEFSPTSDSSCKGSKSVSVFENKAEGYWWDPESWRCAGGKNYECSPAVPDIHRVPCTSDTVVIPNANDSLYRIIFTDPMPTVASLILGNKSVSTSEFFEFTSSREGTERVSKQTDSINNINFIYIENEGSCSDFTGCLCHTTTTTTPKFEICRHMSQKCPPTSCMKPVKMEGFCCLKCGSEISISPNGTLHLNQIQNILERVLLMMEEGNQVDGYTAKMSDGLIHVYFLPKHNWDEYKSAATTFLQLFGRELNTNDKHIIQSLVAEGSMAQQIAENTSRSRLTTSILTIIFIGIIIVVAVYIYRKRRTKELPFMFRRMSLARMSMRSRSSSILPQQTSHVAAFSTSTGRSFINPSFNETEAFDSFSTEASLHPDLPNIPEVDAPSHQRENPLFSVHVESGISFNALRDSNTTLDEKCEIVNEETESNEPPEILTQENQEGNDILISLETSHAYDDEGEGKEIEVQEDEEDPLEVLARSRIESVKETQKPDESSAINEGGSECMISADAVEQLEEIKLNEEELEMEEKKDETTE